MGSLGTQTNLQMAINLICFLYKYGTHTSLCSEVAISQWVERVAEVGAEKSWASHLASEVAEACSTDVQLLTSASSLLIGDKVLDQS